MATISLILFVPLLFIILCSFGAMAFIGIWTYRDAKARGLNAALWTVVVLLVPSMIGLIVYLVAGRNQSVALCSSCSGSLSAKDQFCPKCGAAVTQSAEGSPTPIANTNRGPLIGFIVCMSLVVLSTVAIVGVALLGGWIFKSNLIESAQHEVTVEPTGIVQEDFGNNWNFSFVDWQGEQKKDFFLSNNETMLIVNSKMESGSITLLLANADGSITQEYTLNNGSMEISLSQFAQGVLRLLFSGRARNGSVSIAVK